MKLHVFNDSHGYFLNLVVQRCREAGNPEEHIFINLTDKTIYKNEHTKYLKSNTIAFKKQITALPALSVAVFYPLDETAVVFHSQLKKVQPEIRTDWVFWGYEFYHRPDMNRLNFSGYASRYYEKEFGGKQQLLKQLKRILKPFLFRPTASLTMIQKTWQQTDRFYSFLPQDYKNVFDTIPDHHCQYFPISFLSIDEITRNLEWGHISYELMVGHAATPSLNHAEVLDKLQAMHFSGKLFMPLEYGNDEYRSDIRNKALVFFGDHVSFLENRLQMPAYYQRLSTVGFAIFNFRWQEGLGNLLFLVWNGTKIYLRQESSVYRQFRAWGLTVFSIETDLTAESLSELLETSVRLSNKKIIEALFSEAQLAKYWEPLTDS